MLISGTLDIISLPRSKFGLNIIPISTKFIQCQLTIRNCINNSSNEDLKFIHQETSQGKNVQYDTFKSTREVLKVMRKEKQEHISTLSSQNLVIRELKQTDAAAVNRQISIQSQSDGCQGPTEFTWP